MHKRDVGKSGLCIGQGVTLAFFFKGVEQGYQIFVSGRCCWKRNCSSLSRSAATSRRTIF